MLHSRQLVRNGAEPLIHNILTFEHSFVKVSHRFHEIVPHAGQLIEQLRLHLRHLTRLRLNFILLLLDYGVKISLHVSDATLDFFIFTLKARLQFLA